MKSEVKSRFGIGLVVFEITGLMMIALGTYAVWHEYSQSGWTKFASLGVALALLGIFVSVIFPTLTVVVKPMEIYAPYGPLKRTLPFERVEKVIDFSPTLSQKRIIIRRDPRSPGLQALAFSLAPYANAKEIVQAILEAAHCANPNVQIDPELLRKYGSPPYGIFEPKE